MKYQMDLAKPTLSSLRRCFENSRRRLWFGALSFEERCSGSLASIERNDLRVDKMIALEYSIDPHPMTEGRERIRKNKDILQDFNDRLCAEELEFKRIDSYSFQGLQEIVETAVESPDDFIIFDITCMTKIHALALAATLAQIGSSCKWAIAYSTPENYGNLGGLTKGFGWQDIIIAPLAETASLYNEANGRGIIITGHEADRLIVALGELEPTGGVIVVPDTPKRPDLRYVSTRINSKIVRQLTGMRLQSWTRHVVSIDDLAKLRSCISREVDLARRYEAPVMLFPYGPKSLIFFSALQLSSEYPEASWFVYPILSTHFVSYSEGIENTMWLMPKTVAVPELSPLPFDVMIA
jgi:hypothetical protein